MKVDKSNPAIYLAIFVVSFFIKIFFAWFLPLLPDEAYYWVWSNHHQWSYFDHPPAVSWLFSLGQIFTSYGSAVRWPAILLGHGSFVIWFFIAREFLADKYLFWFVFLYLANPLLGPGSLIITPDVPLLFFWSAGVFFLLRIQTTPHIIYFLGYGATIGLGFCSKYQMVLHVLAGLVCFFSQSKLRKSFLPHFFASIATAIFFSLPVLIWNLQNDFVSFRFQANHGLGASDWNPEWTWSYLVGQLLLLSPLVVWKAIKKKPRTDNMLLFWLTAFPLLFFLLTSFKGRVEANWPLVAFPSVLLLAVYNSQKIRGLVLSILFHAIVFVGAIVQIYSPWLPGYNSKDLKTSDFFKYDGLVKEVAEVEPLFARDYQSASVLSFKLNRPVYKLHGMNRRDFFDYRPESKPQSSTYYVILENGEPLSKWAVTNGHTVIERKSLTPPYELARVEAK